MSKKKIVQLKQAEVKKLRKKLLKKQGGVCLICGEIPKRPILDHHHTKRIKGSGQCRGVLDSNMNVFLAKIENNAPRYGVTKEKLPSILRKVADYLELEHLPYLHYTEAPKPKKLTKSSYNELCRALVKIGYSRKIPLYREKRKSRHVQILTKPLERLFNEVGITPKFYDIK